MNKNIFIINTIMTNHGKNNKSAPRCPNCNKMGLRIQADNNNIRLYCTNCYTEQYYMRIVKRLE